MSFVGHWLTERKDFEKAKWLSGRHSYFPVDPADGHLLCCGGLPNLLHPKCAVALTEFRMVTGFAKLFPPTKWSEGNALFASIGAGDESWRS